MRFCLWHDRGYHYHHWLLGTGVTAMKTHRLGRWVVGAVAVAAFALLAIAPRTGATVNDIEWTAPVGQIVAR